jgi:hypothetical protein
LAEITRRMVAEWQPEQIILAREFEEAPNVQQ